MARTSDPNSATSQWFINTADNSQSLGPSNGGGYAVFGQVIGNGMDVVNAIAALPNFQFQSPFSNLPLQNYTQADYNNDVQVQTSNLVVINSVTVVPEASTLLSLLWAWVPSLIHASRDSIAESSDWFDDTHNYSRGGT